MPDPALEGSAEAAFLSLRKPYSPDSGESDGSPRADARTRPAEDAGPASEPRRGPNEALDDVDRLAFVWLQEAEQAREEALVMRQQMADDLAAARADMEWQREAVLEQARQQGRAESDLVLRRSREEAADLAARATEEAVRDAQVERERLIAAARAEAVSVGDQLRESARAEASRILDEAVTAAAEVRQQATAEAEAKAVGMIGQAEARVTRMLAEAATAIDRLVAEARREEARVLLEAHARVDEVRSRLIRLYQEIDAAAAGRGSPGPGTRGSREGT